MLRFDVFFVKNTGFYYYLMLTVDPHQMPNLNRFFFFQAMDGEKRQQIIQEISIMKGKTELVPYT